MNCKPGDLAIIVRSGAGNEGKIVEVIRPLGERPYYRGHYWSGGDGFCWEVKSAGGKLQDTSGEASFLMPAPDAWLRPIRPGDLEDETPTVRELETQ